MGGDRVVRQGHLVVSASTRVRPSGALPLGLAALAVCFAVALSAPAAETTAALTIDVLDVTVGSAAIQVVGRASFESPSVALGTDGIGDASFPEGDLRAASASTRVTAAGALVRFQVDTGPSGLLRDQVVHGLRVTVAGESGSATMTTTLLSARTLDASGASVTDVRAAACSQPPACLRLFPINGNRGESAVTFDLPLDRANVGLGATVRPAEMASYLGLTAERASLLVEELDSYVFPALKVYRVPAPLVEIRVVPEGAPPDTGSIAASFPITANDGSFYAELEGSWLPAGPAEVRIRVCLDQTECALASERITP